MLLLLPLLFKGLLCHGASKVGKLIPGGKIPVVVHCRMEKFWGGPGGRGSNAPTECPWSLPARLVPGKVSLAVVLVNLSDLGVRMLARGRGCGTICNLFNHIHKEPLYGALFSCPFIPSLSSTGLRTPSFSCRRAPLLPRAPDLLLCQSQLDTHPGLRLAGRAADSWLGQCLGHHPLSEALVPG